MFPKVAPELVPILEELRAREPIFHVPEFATTMAPDYWEVGASGRRYSREFIVRHLENNPPGDAAAAGWECSDFGLKKLSPDVWLLTYTLRQAERLTRRSTIWQKNAEGWVILYHQGTIATAEE